MPADDVRQWLRPLVAHRWFGIGAVVGVAIAMTVIGVAHENVTVWWSDVEDSARDREIHTALLRQIEFMRAVIRLDHPELEDGDAEEVVLLHHNRRAKSPVRRAFEDALAAVACFAIGTDPRVTTDAECIPIVMSSRAATLAQLCACLQLLRIPQ